jgi:hypothetical protein
LLGSASKPPDLAPGTGAPMVIDKDKEGKEE